MGKKLKITAAGIVVLILTGCANYLSENEKREMREASSEYQQVALEDLQVSEAEYRDAVDKTHSCVKDKGFGVGPIVLSDGDQLGFTSSSNGSDGPSSDEMEACYAEYLNQIGRIWVSQGNSLTE